MPLHPNQFDGVRDFRTAQRIVQGISSASLPGQDLFVFLEAIEFYIGYRENLLFLHFLRVREGRINGGTGAGRQMLAGREMYDLGWRAMVRDYGDRVSVIFILLEVDMGAYILPTVGSNQCAGAA